MGIWQCDGAGHYHHPGDGGRADPSFQGFGRASLGKRALLTTQLYVQGDPHNARDSLWRQLDAAARAAITAPFQPGSEGLQARLPIVMAT